MRKALLVGINKYPNGYALGGCLEDINALKKVLERNGDGSENFQITSMPDAQTSEGVMTSICQLFEGDGEMSLFYFSGHGIPNTTGVEIAIPRSMAIKGQYYKGLQMTDIMKVVNSSKVKNKIIILDCCHAGYLGKNAFNETSSIIEPGVSILAACSEDENAREVAEGGVFTTLLCEALEGGAADFCGNITIGGIYAYIERAIGIVGQRPVFKSSVSEFTPIRKVEPQIPLDVIKQIPSLFVTPDEEFKLDPSFEETNSQSAEHTIREPQANKVNVEKFKTLQKLQSIGFVKPIDREHMYWAAMDSKSCELTRIGKYYWKLVREGKL